MPIGLGLASSHAPPMYMGEEWLNKRVLNPELRARRPGAFGALTPTDIKSDYKRFRSGHAELKRQLEKYNPDALIIIAGDQSETFDKSNKANLMIYTGAEAKGYNSGANIKGQLSEEYHVSLKCDEALSKLLLKELVKDGFDMAFSSEIKPLGRGPEKGLPHAFANPMNELLSRPDLPTVLIYENTYDPPALISAARCYELGESIARILKNDPRRIAIYGSGGLSHDSGGPREGWIDEPLDHWVLDQITSGNGRELKHMYEFESMTLDSGTGEIRAWITVVGAMDYIKGKPTIVDYFPAFESITGVSFAYWYP